MSNSLSVAAGTGLFAKPTIGRSEYGRVKVALAPGKGFMDWLRLTSNKHLTKRRPEGVDHVELMKHNTKNDCWVHLFGIVYDVTKYLEFHPGGIPELLRAAGRDATPLFNQYHAWVNYESMLKACVVGPFIGDVGKLPPPLPSTIPEDVNKLAVPSMSCDDFGSRVETQTDLISFEHDDWTNLGEENVIVALENVEVKKSITTCGTEQFETQAKLRVLIRHFFKPAMQFQFEPTPELVGKKIQKKIGKNRVEIRFSDFSGNFQTIFGRDRLKIERKPGVSYHKCRILEILPINHDTRLFIVEFPEFTDFRIPIGHHVSVKIRKGNAVLYRPYTPIRDPDPRKLQFMIKIYPDGICTPALEKLEIGQTLEISDPIGDKNFAEWICNSSQLVLLGAGTGITPLVDILEKRVENSGNLLFLAFNKTEKDVQTEVDWKFSRIWNKFDGNHENNRNGNVLLKNVISSPDDVDSLTSPFVHSRISASLLSSHLQMMTSSSESDDVTRRIFVCGPDGFISAAISALEAVGCSMAQIHVFQG